MIAGGRLPGPRASAATTPTRPRVGDGFVRVDADGPGRPTPARTRCRSTGGSGWSGDLDGPGRWPTLTRELVPPRRRPDEETLSAVLGGRAHRDTEVGDDRGLADRARRSRCGRSGEHIGALVLVRDVTDLRRRDRELVTKDATIREIHHRVKNNLQTVAALLRLQARRIDVAGGASWRSRRRSAGSGSIAIVHETLSQACRRASTSTRSPTGSARWSPTSARAAATGSSYAGRGRSACCPPRRRPPLAMVLTELLQNAVEHGYPEDVGTEGDDRASSRERLVGPAARHGRRRRRRAAGRVRPRTTSTNLGLSIVRTLVESELGGLLELRPRPRPAGARVVVDVPAGRRGRRAGVRRCGRGRGRCGA